MISEALHSLRREIADFDPFGSPPANTMQSLTLVDEQPTEAAEVTYRRAAGRRSSKERRAPSRDISDLLDLYVGECMVARETSDRFGRTVLEDEPIVEFANLLNVKTDYVIKMWRAWRRLSRQEGHSELSEAERREAERELAALRRLAPIRTLIALAHRPHEGERRDLEAALESAFVDPRIRALATDVALMLDLVEQLRELSADALPKLFEVYRELVDAEPTVRSYVVNYARNCKQPAPEAIYPPVAAGSEGA